MNARKFSFLRYKPSRLQRSTSSGAEFSCPFHTDGRVPRADSPGHHKVREVLFSLLRRGGHGERDDRRNYAYCAYGNITHSCIVSRRRHFETDDKGYFTAHVFTGERAESRARTRHCGRGRVHRVSERLPAPCGRLRARRPTKSGCRKILSFSVDLLMRILSTSDVPPMVCKRIAINGAVHCPLTTHIQNTSSARATLERFLKLPLITSPSVEFCGDHHSEIVVCPRLERASLRPWHARRLYASSTGTIRYPPSRHQTT